MFGTCPECARFCLLTYCESCNAVVCGKCWTMHNPEIPAQDSIAILMQSARKHVSPEEYRKGRVA